MRRQRSSSDWPACCRRASLRATCTLQPGARSAAVMHSRRTFMERPLCTSPPGIRQTARYA